MTAVARPSPSPATTPRLQAGGTLDPRRHLYIERPEDRTLLRLLQERQYVNVLTSRQMGKSSLMVRTAHALVADGVRCALVDLAGELGTPDEPATYYVGLLGKVARDLRLRTEVASWWQAQSGLTMNQRLLAFFREVVAKEIAGPVVVFLDEIDSTLKLAWTDNLFTAIRSMYNGRPLVPEYERITFCLLGVATPNELIKDRRTTPYNVGTTLELRDFDPARDDLTPLSRFLHPEAAVGGAMLARILHWTGGHPYLTTKLCADANAARAEHPGAVDQAVEQAFASLDRVAADDHVQQILRFVETRLSDGLATFELYRRILKGVREPDRPTLAHAELKLSGLARRDAEGRLVVRNRIYARLFDDAWVAGTAPRRTIARYRRWAIAASLALVLAVGGGVVWQQVYVAPGLGELQLREELAALGVGVVASELGEGISVRFHEDTSQETFASAVQLAQQLAPVLGVQFPFLRGAPGITDLAPLAGLTNLQALSLNGTQVSDLAPLAGLTNLQWLSLVATRVTDLAPLAGLTNLQGLGLDNTQVSNLAPLAGLTNLRSLSLGNTQVSNLAPLAGLTNMQVLVLHNTQVSNLAPLAGLPSLQVLDLRRTPVTDLAPLAGLTDMQQLWLNDTPVTDLAPLAGLTNLQRLDLRRTPVSVDELERLREALAARGNTALEVNR